MAKILIGGGSGMVGLRLSKRLKSQGHEVSHLSRSNNKDSEFPIIQWDPSKLELDATSIKEFDHIVNLAGAGIVDEPWTEKRKQVIIDSRIKSNNTLKKAIEQLKSKPKSFTSASAIGYYGMITSEKIFEENHAPGTDFLGETCVKWEESADEIQDLGIRTTKVRIGVVLSKDGGALVKMAQPVKFGVGAPLGKGKQYMPWIHIDDLCEIFEYSLFNETKGAYNAASPNQHTNTTFTKELAEVLNKPLWLPNVPAFVIKAILGSRSILVLEGSRVSPSKIQEAGFSFKYSELKGALEEIYQ